LTDLEKGNRQRCPGQSKQPPRPTNDFTSLVQSSVCLGSPAVRAAPAPACQMSNQGCCVEPRALEDRSASRVIVGWMRHQPEREGRRRRARQHDDEPAGLLLEHVRVQGVHTRSQRVWDRHPHPNTKHLSICFIRASGVSPSFRRDLLPFWCCARAGVSTTHAPSFVTPWPPPSSVDPMPF